MTAKLLPQDVFAIRREAEHGTRLKALARRYDVTERYVFQVVYGNARQDVQRPNPNQLKLRFKRAVPRKGRRANYLDP